MAKPDDFFTMEFGVGLGGEMRKIPRPKDREDELAEALAQARMQLNALEVFIEKLKQEPLTIGTIVRVTLTDSKGKSQRGIVASASGLLECNILPDCVVGSQVKILLTTKQVSEVLDELILFGPLVTVTSYDENLNVAFFTLGMATSSAVVPDWLDEPEVGDRLRLDPTGHVALDNLGRDKERFTVEADSVSWDDIGGLEEAKEALREAIEYPITHAAIYARYGQRPARGVLLYGPPGCGKTLLAKAVAGAVEASGGFIYVKGAELLSKWVGEGEGNVREIFARARSYKEETGKSAVIFVDEADAVLGIRGQHHGVGTNQMLVPSFLAEMDGLEESSAFVVLGTNRPEHIDPAVLRDGRIDRRVRVGRPGRAAVTDILRICMRERPCADLDAFVNHACEVLFSDDMVLHELHFEDSAVETLSMRDVLSGAVVAGVVHRAVELAIKRERDGGERTGVTLDDFSEAARAAFRELGAINHRDAIVDYVETRGGNLVAVTKGKHDSKAREASSRTDAEFGRAGVRAARNTGN